MTKTNDHEEERTLADPGLSNLPSILLADDEAAILDNVELLLEAEGYEVLTASDAFEALEVMQSQPVALILADIAMPRMNGYQLYDRVRQNPDWLTIPFMFLTARTLDSDVRYGKELGVDDYLTKPIQPEDLLAAIQGKLRRAEQLRQLVPKRADAAISTASPVAVRQLRIDPGQHQVWLGEDQVRLSAREFTLLEHLARHADQVIGPRELIRSTHGLDTDQMEAGSLLRPLIRSLRRKLGYPAGDTGCIINVRSVGYRLTPPQKPVVGSSEG
jgi:DNA-binding response OmpR family regulator